jgi:hypothetical protein
MRHGIDAQARRQQASDEHREHHRITKLMLWVKFQYGVDDRPLYNRRIE